MPAPRISTEIGTSPLNLPPVVKEMLQQGELNAGHARALLNAKRPEELARQVIAKGLSVRETESFTQKAEADGRVRHTAKPAKRSEIATLERDLSTLLDLKVTISTRRHGGSLMIHFTSREQLEEIVRRLTPIGSPLEKRPNGDAESVQQGELAGGCLENSVSRAF